MRRPPTALQEIGGLAVAVIVASMAVAFALVAALPTPRSPRMTPLSVAGALTGPAPAPGLALRVGDEPRGPRAPLVEQVLAQAMGRPGEEVRAVWIDPPPPGPAPSLQVIRTPSARILIVPASATRPGGPLPSLDIALLNRRSTAPRAALLPATLAVLAAMPQPAFVAGVRLPDGRWRTAGPVRPFWSGWRLRLFAAFGAGAALLAALGWTTARRITRPLRLLADRAGWADISAAAPPPLEEGPREVRAAADAMDAMRARLAEQHAARTRMLAAVAHDLRTPLTGLRIRAERAPPDVRDRMIDDIGRMEAMITGVLHYAQDQARPPRRIDLQAVAGERAAEAAARGRPVALAPGHPVWVRADVHDLGRAIDNLLDNASAYAGGGRMRVRAEDGEAVVRVEDDGPGVPEADRLRLLEPFQRGEASRSRDTGGVGLGLSVVHDAARRQGGRFSLEDAPGGGLAAVLRLRLD